MKKTLFLDDIGLPEIKVLAINSHAKAYKLCWNINKELKLNFQKSEYKEITCTQLGSFVHENPKPQQLKTLELEHFQKRRRRVRDLEYRKQ